MSLKYNLQVSVRLNVPSKLEQISETFFFYKVSVCCQNNLQQTLLVISSPSRCVFVRFLTKCLGKLLFHSFTLKQTLSIYLFCSTVFNTLKENCVKTESYKLLQLLKIKAEKTRKQRKVFPLQITMHFFMAPIHWVSHATLQNWKDCSVSCLKCWHVIFQDFNRSFYFLLIMVVFQLGSC